MKSKTAIVATAALLCFMATTLWAATATAPLAKTNAKKFLGLLAAKKYAKASAMCTKKVSDALPTPKLKAVWEKVQTQAGAYKKIVSIKQLVAQGHQVVDMTCAFAKTRLVVRTAIDGKGKIAGLFFLPAK